MEGKEYIEGHKKRAAAVAVAVIGVIVVGAFIASDFQFEPESDQPTGEEVTSPEDTNETEEEQLAGWTTAEAIEGDITDIAIDDERVDPFRPEISPEDGVRFTNDGSHDFVIEFDRDDMETVTLAQSDSGVIDVERIVYYTVNPVDEEVEFREISGSINVQ